MLSHSVLLTLQEALSAGRTPLLCRSIWLAGFFTLLLTVVGFDFYHPAVLRCPGRLTTEWVLALDSGRQERAAPPHAGERLPAALPSLSGQQSAGDDVSAGPVWRLDGKDRWHTADTRHPLAL